MISGFPDALLAVLNGLRRTMADARHAVGAVAAPDGFSVLDHDIVGRAIFADRSVPEVVDELYKSSNIAHVRVAKLLKEKYLSAFSISSWSCVNVRIYCSRAKLCRYT